MAHFKYIYIKFLQIKCQTKYCSSQNGKKKKERKQAPHGSIALPKSQSNVNSPRLKHPNLGTATKQALDGARGRSTWTGMLGRTAALVENSDLETTECTHGPLKLFWNKHFPKVIKRCSEVRSIRTMNFIDLRYTVQHLLPSPRVHSFSSVCSQEAVQLKTKREEMTLTMAKLRDGSVPK